MKWTIPNFESEEPPYEWEPPNYKPEDYTCFDCPHKDTCEYAWDYYNVNGDCLAIK